MKISPDQKDKKSLFKKHFAYLKLTEKELNDPKIQTLLEVAWNHFDQCRKIKERRCSNKGDIHLQAVREWLPWEFNANQLKKNSTKETTQVSENEFMGNVMLMQTICSKLVNKANWFDLTYERFIVTKPNWFKYMDLIPMIQNLPVTPSDKNSFGYAYKKISNLFETEKKTKKRIFFFNLQKNNINNMAACMLTCEIAKKNIKVALIYCEEFVSRYDKSYWKVDDDLNLLDEAKVIIFIGLGQESFHNKNYILFMTRLFINCFLKRKDVFFFSTTYSDGNGLIQTFKNQIISSANWVKHFFEQLNDLLMINI